MEVPIKKNILWKNPPSKSIFMLFICAFSIIHYFIGAISMQYLLALLLTIVFLLYLANAKLVPRVLSITLFLLGIVISLNRGMNIYEISKAITLNLPLLTLVILVPLLSIPFKLGGFFRSIDYFLKLIVNNTMKMFIGITTFIFFVGPFFHLGTLRLLNEIVLNDKIKPILTGKAYIVGFSTVVLWSPYFGSVALVLFYLNITVTDYIFIGLLFAITQLVIGNILFLVFTKNNEAVSTNKVMNLNLDGGISSLKEHQGKVIHLLIILLSLMISILILENITKISMLMLVSIISIVFPTIWLTAYRKWSKAKPYFKEYKQNSVSTLSNEIVMFISAGIFAHSLAGSSFAQSLNVLIYRINEISFLVLLVVIMGFVILLTFLGIHQIVIISILAMQLNPSMLGTEPIVLALLLITSWSMSAVISPFTPLNILVSNSVKQSGLTVGLKWNGLYLLCMFIISLLLIAIIHSLYGG